MVASFFFNRAIDKLNYLFKLPPGFRPASLLVCSIWVPFLPSFPPPLPLSLVPLLPPTPALVLGCLAFPPASFPFPGVCDAGGKKGWWPGDPPASVPDRVRVVPRRIGQSHPRSPLGSGVSGGEKFRWVHSFGRSCAVREGSGRRLLA